MKSRNDEDAVRHVLVVMHRWVGYVHGVQLGIAKYAAHRPKWVWTHMHPRPELMAGLPKLRADGVIAFVEDLNFAAFKRLKIPVVDVSNWLSTSAFPQVLVDDEAVGRMGAEYLRNRGLQHFAVYGTPDGAFSLLRQKGFVEAIEGEGLKVHLLRPRRHPVPPGMEGAPGISDEIADWLKEAPKPLGLFATSDTIAAGILASCRRAGLRVPDDICVLGVDNDELITQMSTPPLSSIVLPTQKIGFEAAALLDRLMCGEPRPKSPLLLPPGGVVTRQSTDLTAVADEDIRSAIHFIRQHVEEQVRVTDLLRVVPMNRRYLERKFKQYIGRTPLQEIRRVRLERAKFLLSNTDLPIPIVARKSGFPTAQRLANVFHAGVGVTPTAYRHQSQATQG